MDISRNAKIFSFVLTMLYAYRTGYVLICYLLNSYPETSHNPNVFFSFIHSS